MPQIPAEYRSFKGLLPILDRKRVDKPFICEGSNFIVDVDGPVSIFGKTWLLNQEIDDPRGFQTFRDETTVGTLYFVNDAIMRFDEITRQLFPVFSHAPRTLFWPWSIALVGNRLYFANFELFGAGFLAYDFVAGIWTIITDPTNIPENVYAVTQSFGRLIILSEDRVNVSEIEDGTALVPDTATGAGFQKLSIICAAKQTITVLPYSRGFLAYTCSGILRAEFTNSTNPFRYDVLSREHQVLNAWAVGVITENNREQHVFITPRGLFATFGEEYPTLWGGIMSEFFHRKVIPTIDHLRDDMTTRISADFDGGIISISVAEDSREAIFTRAYTLYVPSEEWGEYSQSHTALIELFLNEGALAGRHFAVCDTNGSIFRFTQTDSDRIFPGVPSDDFIVDYKLLFDPPIQYKGLNTPGSIARTMMGFGNDEITNTTDAAVYNLKFEIGRFCSPVDDIVMDETELVATIFLVPIVAALCGLGVCGASLCGDAIGAGDINKIRFQGFVALQSCINQFTFAKLDAIDAPLNASILVGPFRMPEEDAIDYVAHVQEAVIGMLNEGIADIFEDYIADFIGEDLEENWNLDIFNDEDYGKAAGDLTEYTFKWFGTLDAYTTWRTNDILQEVIPDIIQKNGRIRQVAGNVSGSYMLGEISAFNIGEVFHLKHMKISMTKGGRVF